MKSFRTLTQQIDQWRQTYLSRDSQHQLAHALRAVKRCTRAAKVHLISTQHSASASYVNAASPRKKRCYRPNSPLLLIAVVSLTSAIGYRFYNEPRLDVGTLAPQTLRAPEAARVIDTKTTEEYRRVARTGAVPVLMLDPTINQEIYQALQRLIDQGNEVRRQAGSFPYIEPSTLSTNTQRYLRQAPEWEWRTVVAQSFRSNNSFATGVADRSRTEGAPVNASLQVALIELQNYRRNVSTDDLTAMKEVIERARDRYRSAIADLTSSDPKAPSSFYDASFLDLTDAEWATTKTAIRQALERILSQGIAPGLPSSLLERAVTAQLNSSLSEPSATLARRVLTTILKPNLVQDPDQTKLRAEQAAQAVEPQVVEIRRGEVIVEAGDVITQSDFVLLDYFEMSRRGINWLGLIGFGAVVSGGVGVFLLIEHRFHPGLRRRDHVLILLLTLSAPLVITLGIPASSLPAIGLVVGSFYGSALGVTAVGILSLLLPLGMEVSGIHLIASCTGSLVGAFMAGRLRSREELAMLGGVIGIIQGVMYLLFAVIVSGAASPVWYVVLSTAMLQTLVGIAWSVVALGISPYLENLFDLVTPVRLAELSNPNRPMLKRLASEAPGTFQHTLFVSSLAEAAARALGCNVELVRAGTLYHDIGKMHDAMGFIENQMGGPNKHDLIDDPWKSAAIIKKHVTEGMVMARKCRLPRAVQAFIPEHQGTMSISYFFHVAQQRAQENPDIVVDEADFRYDGPIPQSKETGIVMLADSCEAALRSLKDATPEEALAMVNRIFRARWQDNQLVDSGLTRKDLTRIAEIFVRVWQQFNHQRIPYPKAVLNPQPAQSASS